MRLLHSHIKPYLSCVYAHTAGSFWLCRFRLRLQEGQHGAVWLLPSRRLLRCRCLLLCCKRCRSAAVTRSEAALDVTAKGPEVKLLLPRMRPTAGCELFSTRAAAAALAAACTVAFLLRTRFFAPGLGLGPVPFRAPPLPPPWARLKPGMSGESDGEVGEAAVSIAATKVCGRWRGN